MAAPDSPGRQSSATSATSDRTLDVLIAEDNPISQKILETLLTRMGCRCVCVEDGPSALAATMGSISESSPPHHASIESHPAEFDVIVCDIHMPVVSGEQVARMIRSTTNHNQNTPSEFCLSSPIIRSADHPPVIACTSYEQHQFITEEGTLFSAILAKPVLKADLLKCLTKLGFILSASSGDPPTAST